MTKKYDLAIYIGRFQPLHLGHLHVLEHCNRIANRTLVLVGSSYRPRTLKNPFTYLDRQEMIRAAARSINAPVHTRPIRDFMYRDGKWVDYINSEVNRFVRSHPDCIKVALVGHFKDSSSWYLHAFPDLELVEVEDYSGISATPIRKTLLNTERHFSEWEREDLNSMSKLLPNSTMDWLWKVGHHALKEPREEQGFVQEYQKRYGVGPFVTADSVVTCKGHVLMVVRGKMPGKGLMALPGGFLEKGETLQAAAIREACEETGINLSINHLVNSHYFDAPDRSSRGRIITHAFHFDLPHSSLPKVVGADDAAEACWVKISDISSDEMFEDHWDILDYFNVWELR